MMKRLNELRNTYWLFGRGERELSGGRRWLFRLWNVLLPLAACVGTGLLSLLLAFARYPWEIFRGYFAHPLIAALNLLPVVVLYGLLYCAIGRSWIAYLADSVIVLGLTTADYFLLLFRDDPLMFADILDAPTAMGVAGNYALEMDTRLWFCVVCVALAALALALFVRGRPRGALRITVALLLALGCVFPLHSLYGSNTVYNERTQNYEAANQWSATQRFITRGFVYPFLHSVFDAFPTPPDGYSADYAASLLAGYEDAQIPDGQKVQVVSLMLEAFTDLSDWEIPGLSPEVYAPYHALEAESYTGTLVTNIFAGGTTNTERCYLTGLSTLENFRHRTNSHVWYLRTQGYSAGGSHPCYDWFYNRRNVNGYLGFEEYRFLENHYGALADGGIAYDDVFFPELLRLLREDFAEGYGFTYNLTYQGHGPYSTDTLYWEPCVENVGYTNESWYILNNYFGSVADTIGHLTELTDALRSDEQPVVLVIFGDHKPWLGDANSVYQELGINLDTGTEEGFYNYFSTRYLIWANDAARALLRRDFTGEGPTISPNFLMNVLFEQCGWRGSAWMQYTDSVRAVLPVVTTVGRYVTADGTLMARPEGEAAQVLHDYRIAEYWYKREFQY